MSSNINATLEGCQPCSSDVGLAAGIGVLVSGSVLLLAWLTFYYCQRQTYNPLKSSYSGSSAKRNFQDKNLHGNYFVDAGDSYLLTGETPVEFAYFDNDPTVGEFDQLGSRDLEEGKSAGLLYNKQNDAETARQTNESAAMNFSDGTAAGATFSPSLGDKANFPILAPATDSLPCAGSLTSIHSAAMDLSFWPTLPLESEVDLRPSVLLCPLSSDGGVFRSETMRVEVRTEAGVVNDPLNFTVGMSLRPEDQPEIDQAASLVTAVYSCSPTGTLRKACRLRVPLTCHLMDLEEEENDVSAEAMPQVKNLIVMRSEITADGSSEWRDVGPVEDFVEYSDRDTSDDLIGFVELDVVNAGLYTVRCDGGIWVKSMCLSHFAAALGEDQCWAFRVFLHRDKKTDYERLCQYASEFNMRPVGMPQPFHLPQHSYVHVLVSSITDGCALEGSSHGVLHGEGCWPNLEQPPFVEFRLRQIHGCLPFPLVRVRMDVVIADDYDNITFELLSQWSTQAQMKMDKMMPDDLMNKGQPGGGWPWTLMSPWQQLTNEQVQQLQTILDRPLMGDQDYSTLAAMLGYSEDQVKGFSLQRPSPTEALLKDLHTRLPAVRVPDRLLVALGRMGAVWLCDYLRQACRVDRVKEREERFRDSAQLSDTLKRRIRPGRNSQRYSQSSQQFEPSAPEVKTRASYHRYKRRVQRVSGRRSQLDNSRLSLPGSLTAALTGHRFSSKKRKQAQADNVAHQEKSSKTSSIPRPPMQQPLLSQNSPESEEGPAAERMPSPLSQWALESLRIQSLLSSYSPHGSLERHYAQVAPLMRSSGRYSKREASLQSQTQLVMDTTKHGCMMQIVGSGSGKQAPSLFIVHRDDTMPNRAILRPVPILPRPQNQEVSSPSFMQRFAKVLSRTISAPGTEQDGWANRRAASVRLHKKSPSTSELLSGWPSMPSVGTGQTLGNSSNSTARVPTKTKDRAPSYSSYVKWPSKDNATTTGHKSHSTSSNVVTPPRKESAN